MIKYIQLWKLKKNTLDVEDDKNVIKNVKKYNVKIIENYIKKEVEIKDIPTRIKSEKIYKQKTILKKEEMIPENIIKEGEKRIRIPNKKYSI